MRSVYKLEGIRDDPRYEGFAYNEFRNNPFVLNLPDGGWDAPRLAGIWKPTGIEGRVRRFNDFPGLMTDPAFSQRAVNALADVLEANGELIPFESSAGRYYAYNITTILRALDLDGSAVQYSTRTRGKVLRIFRYEFFPEKLIGKTIFRIPERPGDAYVTDQFVDRVKAQNLRGFAFYKVWPLPMGSDWKAFAEAEMRRMAREGLPEGQSIKGNSLYVDFSLSSSEPTDEERRQIEILADEVDSILVDLTSESPQPGNLDAVEYLDHTCRFIICCPDANALAVVLYPWLANLTWPRGFTTIKRYGSADDTTAREEKMSL